MTTCSCGCCKWNLIWFRALVEEGKPVNLYQCDNCKRIIMNTEEGIED